MVVTTLLAIFVLDSEPSGLGEFTYLIDRLDDYVDEDLLRRLWCDRNRDVLVDAEATLRELRL